MWSEDDAVCTVGTTLQSTLKSHSEVTADAWGRGYTDVLCDRATVTARAEERPKGVKAAIYKRKLS